MTILIGDSIGLSMADELQSGCKVVVDAQEGRQFNTGLAIVRQFWSARQLHKRMVIELGTNGPIVQSDLDEMVGLLGAKRLIWFCSNFGNRSWIPPNNAMLKATVAEHPNVHIIRWRALAALHPEWFSDGIHPNTIGQAAYAGLICEAIA